MKVSRLIVLAAALAAVSCGKKIIATTSAPPKAETPVQQTPPKAEPTPRNQEPGSIILSLESPFETLWESGEKLLLRSAAGNLEFTVEEGGSEVSFTCEDPVFADGNSFSVVRGPLELVAGASNTSTFFGSGTVEDRQLIITLRPVSSFILLPSSSAAEIVPLAGDIHTSATLDPTTGELTPGGAAARISVPEGSSVLSLPSQSGDIAILSRDGETLWSSFVSIPPAGEAVPAPQLTPYSVTAAPRLGVEYSLSNLADYTSGYTPGEFSGITRISDGRYAIVHNGAKGGGIYTMDIKFSDTGISAISAEPAPGTESATSVRDPEGIAYVSQTRTLWVCGEKNQDILEYDLSGNPTGRSMEVPQDLAADKLSTGNGFESLAYDGSKSRLWTVSEEPLKKDADWFPVGQERRIVRLQSFDTGTRKAAQRRFYAMDPPALKKTAGSNYVHGISDIAVLSGGEFLVMEREVHVPKYASSDYASIVNMLVEARTVTKIYLIDPYSSEGILSKVLVAGFITQFPGAFNMVLGGDPTLANYEGMCEGPFLNGHRTLLLVNDSEKGKGNNYARLQDYLKIIAF
ncbi:MAG: esterase-like activity of phytase family protein [Bacteroidales bacterium]|nr:esterase-like activity of phytase family protein [Bacteroidales bacterium]